ALLPGAQGIRQLRRRGTPAPGPPGQDQPHHYRLSTEQGIEMKDRIAIIGAGIGGLAAALALLRRGHDVQVYERAAELGEVGAGIQVTPNSSRVLIALGLESEILQAGTVSSGKTNYLWNTGQQSPFIRLGDNANQAFGAPYLLFHRADLHR